MAKYNVLHTLYSATDHLRDPSALVETRQQHLHAIPGISCPHPQFQARGITVNGVQHLSIYAQREHDIRLQSSETRSGSENVVITG